MVETSLVDSQEMFLVFKRKRWPCRLSSFIEQVCSIYFLKSLFCVFALFEVFKSSESILKCEEISGPLRLSFWMVSRSVSFGFWSPANAVLTACTQLLPLQMKLTWTDGAARWQVKPRTSVTKGMSESKLDTCRYIPVPFVKTASEIDDF